MVFDTLRNIPFENNVEKGKMLVTSIYSLSNILNYPIKEKCSDQYLIFLSENAYNF